MRLILDSSLVIDHLRIKKLSSVFFKTWKEHDLAISLITVAELYSGKSVQTLGAPREELEDILAGIQIVTPTIETVKLAGGLRARYQLSLGDALVAALAIEEKLPILTLDTKAFGKIKEIKLYNIRT